MKRSSVGLFCGCHLCYRRFFVWIRFLSVIRDNCTYELDLFKLEEKFAGLELDGSLVAAFHWGDRRWIFGHGLPGRPRSLLPSPYTRMSSAIRIVALEPSSADVSLMWNSSGAIVIPNGRPNNLYVPCDVCMVVILEDSSSRGIWRKPLISTRGNHFAERSLWSCSFRVGIECFGRWMALFTVWLGSMHTRNFPDDGKCEKYMGIRVVSCLLVEYWMTTFTYRWPCWSLYPCLTIS